MIKILVLGDHMCIVWALLLKMESKILWVNQSDMKYLIEMDLMEMIIIFLISNWNDYS
jgi:hypothetical protein